jgi:hypothetical protein
LTRLKLNLPFQVVGQQSRTATLLLATTIACFAKRPEEFKHIEHLALDHVSDTSLIDICNNPIDVTNMMSLFKGLKHLILSVKRQESRYSRQNLFASNLWHLIEQAKGLQSLCIIGWNIKRNIEIRVYVHGVQQQVWSMRSLPFAREGLSEKLLALRCLELKRVDMGPTALVSLISQTSKTLKELYLNEVYLKVRGSETLGNTSLWIGYPGLPKPQGVCWVAEELRSLEHLNLIILRVTGLGYDDFELSRGSPSGGYDLKDPTSRGRSFDERFVQAVMNGPDPIIIETMNNLIQEPSIWPPIVSSTMSTPSNSRPNSSGSSSSNPIPSFTKQLTLDERKKVYDIRFAEMLAFDAECYQRVRNSTSWFKRCLDDYFFNHNEQALRELQNIITVADRGMALLQSEIDRARDERRYLNGWHAHPAPVATTVVHGIHPTFPPAIMATTVPAPSTAFAPTTSYTSTSAATQTTQFTPHSALTPNATFAPPTVATPNTAVTPTAILTATQTGPRTYASVLAQGLGSNN